jgi:hypothetical protein
VSYNHIAKASHGGRAVCVTALLVSVFLTTHPIKKEMREGSAIAI